jgi:hypothetical protein
VPFLRYCALLEMSSKSSRGAGVKTPELRRHVEELQAASHKQSPEAGVTACRCGMRQQHISHPTCFSPELLLLYPPTTAAELSADDRGHGQICVTKDSAPRLRLCRMQDLKSCISTMLGVLRGDWPIAAGTRERGWFSWLPAREAAHNEGRPFQH